MTGHNIYTQYGNNKNSKVDYTSQVKTMPKNTPLKEKQMKNKRPNTSKKKKVV